MLTLKELQLEYLDLYMMHWPVRMKKGSVGFKPKNLTETDIGSTWRAMEAAYDAGEARAIGVSNFSRKKMNDLLQIARVPPAVNQVECHPMWQQPQLHQFCASHGIHLSGYSPLGSPGTEGIKGDDVLIKASSDQHGGRETGEDSGSGGPSVGPPSWSQCPPQEHKRDQNQRKLGRLRLVHPGIFNGQERLNKGNVFVHETLGFYKTIEQLWDGEL
ncbi:hypothetical protein K1719_012951 [Acacia pycnantha]|nr:hypothetical protein K1719_012951 [Acacia pycnantha]